MITRAWTRLIIATAEGTARVVCRFAVGRIACRRRIWLLTSPAANISTVIVVRRVANLTTAHRPLVFGLSSGGRGGRGGRRSFALPANLVLHQVRGLESLQLRMQLRQLPREQLDVRAVNLGPASMLGAIAGDADRKIS